jgi:hypothetical protein
MLEWMKSLTPAQNFAWTSIYVVGIALLGIGAFFGLAKGGKAMALATVTPAIETSIPVIDANAPIGTKSATFSLG